MAKRKGKGSLGHQLLQQRLAYYFRTQGKVAVIEGFIGKNVDILVYDSTKTIAVEIQLDSRHCLQVKRDFEFGCDEVWIICTSLKVLNLIKRKLQNNIDNFLLDKTRFFLIKDLFRTNNKNNTTTRNKIVEKNSGIKQIERG